MKNMLISLLIAVALAAPPLLLPNDRIEVEIKIGSPTQKITLLPDTSALFSAVSLENTENRDKNAYLFTKQSKTLKTLNSVEVDDFFGSYSAVLARDSGVLADFTLDSFEFALITKFDPSYLKSKTGILGLALTNPTLDKYSLFANLPEDKKKVTFSYFASKHSVSFGKEATDYDSKCEVGLNKYSSSLFKHGWNCDLSHFMVKTGNFDRAVTAKSIVSFDSGSSFIRAPLKYKQIFIDSLDKSCSYRAESQFDFIVCPKGAVSNSLTFIIQGTGYTLTGEQLMLPFSEEESVYGVVFSTDLQSEWTLGLVFFKQYQLTFDYLHRNIAFSGPEIQDYSKEFKEYLKESKAKERFTKQIYLIIVILLFTVALFFFILYVNKHSAKMKTEGEPEFRY